MFDSFVFLPLSTRAYFKGRAYIKIILKNHARSYFAGRSYYRGNTVVTIKTTTKTVTLSLNLFPLPPPGSGDLKKNICITIPPSKLVNLKNNKISIDLVQINHYPRLPTVHI